MDNDNHLKKAANQSTVIKHLAIRSIICLALGAFTFFMVLLSSTALQNVTESKAQLIKLANQYRIGSKNLTSAVQSYAVTGDEAYYNAYYQELNEDKNRDIALEGMKAIGITSSEQAYIDQISSTSNQLVPLEEAAMEAVKANDLAGAAEDVFGESYESSLKIITGLTEEFIAALEERVSKQISAYNRFSFVMDVLCGFFLLLVILSTLRTLTYVRKKMLEPINQVKEQMEYISGGDLSKEFTLEADTSEIGRMAFAIHNTKITLKKLIGEISFVMTRMAACEFNCSLKENYVGEFLQIHDSYIEIMENLNKMFGTIQSSADFVRDSSRQMSEVSQDFAEGTGVQADSINHIREAINELSANVKESAAAAEKSRDITQHSGEGLNQNYNNMQELKNAIYEIKESSENIRGIINTIEDIATETNLLALNAAIEAARAGEAGKGFAVVADQVKSLASESAEAAGNTTKLIQTSIDLVERGTAIAEVTARDLAGVMEESKKTMEMMENVAISTQKEVSAMEEITKSVDQIADVIQTNSAAAQQTAASSQEQNSQAELLSGLMAEIKLV